MTLLITGSIATDHLMSFPGVFADSLVADKLDKIALSFLVEDLEVRRGGTAANVAFGLGKLGLGPILVGAAGQDFGDYRSWLERHGVDCDSVHVDSTRHTARFVCTTDSTMAQIASFYPGAMQAARDIELAPVVDRVGEPTWVLVTPNDPEAMARHSQECRERGYRLAADPSQQLSFATTELVRTLVEGADLLFTNEYESALIMQKSGWSESEILERVTAWVITLGGDGVRVLYPSGDSFEVGVVPGVTPVEPTGVGDAFRAGFLAGLTWGVSHERAAQLGCLLAAYVVESVGTQEYDFTNEEFLARLETAYGAQARADVADRLS